ncbi:GNAT family N-acetyltransferase [Candidatus Babeliales bacterium]|nr:GNAT family N-acetyltransferase [Candidatus Babeliales bacterium]
MAKIEFFFEKELSLKMIADTFKKTFNQKFDFEYWNWRFKNNPNNEKIYINYIIENGILAAYYAVSPCVIEIESKGIFKIALSNMTMTHPDFQGRGYFKKLAFELYNVLKQDGFVGVYGFANVNSHYGFRKYLNWVDLASLNIFKTSKTSFRNFLLKDKENYNFKNFNLDNKNLEITKTLSFKTNKIHLVRDIKNLYWRFFSNPSQTYFGLKINEGQTVAGLILYKLFGDEIDIMEYFFNPGFEEQRYNILGIGIEYLMNKYKGNLNIWSNLYTQEHLMLEKLGFKELEFNSYFGIIPFVDNQELLDIKNWHYRFMDSDIF